mmetsp:Transcript_25508/g.50018  ORF Transcript_25508/g.50018 Transcript_25508/m.50018 type:complete len:140 (+) Transcript_25508:794-1213(+)
MVPSTFILKALGTAGCWLPPMTTGRASVACFPWRPPASPTGGVAPIPPPATVALCDTTGSSTETSLIAVAVILLVQMCFESAQTCLVSFLRVQSRAKGKVDTRDITVGTVLAARVEGGVLAIIYINKQNSLRRVFITNK